MVCVCVCVYKEQKASDALFMQEAFPIDSRGICAAGGLGESASVYSIMKKKSLQVELTLTRE